MILYERNVLVFGTQPETDLICKSRDGCLVWSAETMVDASFSNRVWDWMMRMLSVEILMQISDGM